MRKDRIKRIFEKVRTEKRNNLTEHESREVLRQYGIPLVKGELASNVDEALEIAKRIGYPVVLKVCSPDIIHKSDVGAIALNLKSEKEVREAFSQIIRNTKKKEKRIHGVMVEKMVEGGQEIIVGGKKDPQFGQTILFGLGGIFTEIFKDTSLRVTPIDRKEAKRMIGEIKGYEILMGYRGQVYDTEAIVKILCKVSELLEENGEIKELDINPIKVLRKGAVAVDARIVIEQNL